jgi:hypothetical protein
VGSQGVRPYGKAEAWAILEAVPEAVVHLGMRRDVEVGELADRVDRRDTGAMLDAANRRGRRSRSGLATRWWSRTRRGP